MILGFDIRLMLHEANFENSEIFRRDFKQFIRELRSDAMIVSHSKEVEFLKIAGFPENETLLPSLSFRTKRSAVRNLNALTASGTLRKMYSNI